MPPQLLVIEDDHDSLELLSMLLESAGFGIEGAQRSTIATDKLRRGAYDLVLADFLVDTIDPVASWSAIDGLVELARPCPVGLLTAWPITPEQRSDHGLAFVIAKPCSSETLLAQLSSALETHPLSPAHEQAIRAYFEHLERAAYDELVAACTPDVVYHLPSTDPRFAKTIRGREAFRAFAAATFETFREPRFEIHEIRPLPRGALVRYTGSWCDASGSRTSLAGAVLFVFDGLQITEIGVRVDAARVFALA